MFSDIKRKMGKKSRKVIAMLTLAALLCGFTGCDKRTASFQNFNGSSSVYSNISTDASEGLQEDSSSYNVTTLSGDFSVQEIHSNDYDVKPEIMIDTHIVVLPCTIKDLNDVGISLDLSTLASVEGSDGKITNATQIYYNDNILGMVCFNGAFNDESDFGNALVVQLLISKFEAEHCNAYVSYSGLDFQSTKEEVIEKLGDGYCDFYGSPHYGTPERHIYIDIGSDNKISSFELSVESC